MSDIEQISNGEVGLSVKDKINDTIAEANKLRDLSGRRLVGNANSGTADASNDVVLDTVVDGTTGADHDSVPTTKAVNDAIENLDLSGVDLTGYIKESDIKDDDDFINPRNDTVASSQSIKAYIDGRFEFTPTAGGGPTPITVPTSTINYNVPTGEVWKYTIEIASGGPDHILWSNNWGDVDIDINRGFMSIDFLNFFKEGSPKTLSNVFPVGVAPQSNIVTGNNQSLEYDWTNFDNKNVYTIQSIGPTIQTARMSDIPWATQNSSESGFHYSFHNRVIVNPTGHPFIDEDPSLVPPRGVTAGKDVDPAKLNTYNRYYNFHMTPQLSVVDVLQPKLNGLKVSLTFTDESFISITAPTDALKDNTDPGGPILEGSTYLFSGNTDPAFDILKLNATPDSAGVTRTWTQVQ